MNMVMKRISIISALFAAAAIFASCENNIVPQTSPEEASGAVTITASFPVDTKVSMDETATGLDLKWKDTDFLTVVGTTTEKFKIATISPDGKTATFTGNRVQGESFKVILSDLGEDYLTRNYNVRSSVDSPTDTKADLPYDAVLENVVDYTNVCFTEEWAKNNNATFLETGCVMLHIQVPEDCKDVSYVKLVATDNVFSTTNGKDAPKIYYREVLFNNKQTVFSDGTIKAYFMTPMSEDRIAPDGKVMVWLEGSTYHVKNVLLPTDYTVMPGKRNVIKVNKKDWTTKTKVGWNNNKTTWKAPYCNISHWNVGPGKIIDSDKNSLWQAPWDGNNNRPVLDEQFTGWTHTGENTARVPMIGIINFGDGLDYVHTIQLTRRQGSNGYLTRLVEIWVSSDTSNDESLGEHLNQNLTSGMTNDMITGYWDEWDAKKWVKLCQTNDDFTKDVKSFIVHGVSFKYMKVVILSEDTNPVLALGEIEFKTYQ